MLALVAVVMVAVTAGLVILIVPGVYLLLACSQSGWLILDKKARLFDAIRRSIILTQGNIWNLAQAYILLGLIGIPGKLIHPIKLSNDGQVHWGVPFMWGTIGEVWSTSIMAVSIFVSAALYLQLSEECLVGIPDRIVTRSQYIPTHQAQKGFPTP
jgi:hypothetical protein